jgi:hypothetical protein
MTDRHQERGPLFFFVYFKGNFPPTTTELFRRTLTRSMSRIIKGERKKMSRSLHVSSLQIISTIPVCRPRPPCRLCLTVNTHREDHKYPLSKHRSRVPV